MALLLTERAKHKFGAATPSPMAIRACIIESFLCTNNVVYMYHGEVSNGFSSQLANVLIKSTDNRTRGHDVKLIKQTCSVNATKYYFPNRVVNVWNSLLSPILLAY